MKIQTLVCRLRRLAYWLRDSKKAKQLVLDAASELEQGGLTDFRRRQLRHLLSSEMLFHPKWLGDLYIPDFEGDWWVYLSELAAFCQQVLGDFSSPEIS